MQYLYYKISFNRQYDLEEFLKKEKINLKPKRRAAILKNKELQQFHMNYSHALGRVSSILFMKKADLPEEAPITVAAALNMKSDDPSLKPNNFIEFFNQFFKVPILTY